MPAACRDAQPSLYVHRPGHLNECVSGVCASASSSSCPRFVRRCSSLPSLVCARAPAQRIGEVAGGQPPATASPPTATTKVPKAAHLAPIRQPPFNPLCSELHAHAHALVLAGLLCGRATTTLMLCVNVCLNIQSGSLLPKAHSSSKVELVPGHFHEAQPLGADLASLPRAPLSVDSRGWRTTRGETLTAAGIFRGHRREQTKLSSDSRSGVFSCDEMTAALAFSWHGMASDAFPTSPNAAEPRPGPQKRHEPTNSRDGKSSTALVIGPSPAGGSLQVLAPVSWRVRLPSKPERSQAGLAGWQGRGSSGSGSGFSLSHPPHLTVGLASCHRESSCVLPCGYRRGRDPELRSHAQWPWADFWYVRAAIATFDVRAPQRCTCNNKGPGTFFFSCTLAQQAAAGIAPEMTKRCGFCGAGAASSPVPCWCTIFLAGSFLSRVVG